MRGKMAHLDNGRISEHDANVPCELIHMARLQTLPRRQTTLASAVLLAHARRGPGGPNSGTPKVLWNAQGQGRLQSPDGMGEERERKRRVGPLTTL